MVFEFCKYKSLKRYFKSVLINTLVLLILILILELVLQILKPYDLYKRTYPNQIKDRTFNPKQVKVNWMKIDTTVGWVCSASDYLQFTNKFYNAYKIKYMINKEGYRASFNFTDEISSSKNKIMLLGESFLFGVYLDYNNTMVGYLEQIDSINRYYNFGIPGYGLDQIFMTFRKYIDVIHPDIIVLIYIDDDIPRILESYRIVEGLNKPSYKMFAEGFEHRLGSDDKFLLKLLNNSYVLNKFYQKYLDYAAIAFTKKILNQIKKESKKEVIIIRWPRKEMLSWNKLDWYYDLSEFCKDNDIQFINLADLFVNFSAEKIRSFYLAYDGHPSEIGNKYVAKLLHKEIKGLLNK